MKTFHPNGGTRTANIGAPSRDEAGKRLAGFKRKKGEKAAMAAACHHDGDLVQLASRPL
jgi:hypothetical protein